MFLRDYAIIVKNLRGVILANLEEANIENCLTWLQKRFKYRDLAIPPSLTNIKNFKGLRKPIKLFYPTEELKILVDMLVEEFNLSSSIFEAIILASAYVSPIMAVGNWAKENLEKFAVEKVLSNASLDNKSWKLHFRIADYSVLDAYKWFTNHSKKLWSKKLDAQKFKEERIKKVKNDSKRYWRLSKGEEKTKPLILYLDLAQAIVDRPKLLGKIRKILNYNDVLTGLSMETAVLIP